MSINWKSLRYKLEWVSLLALTKSVPLLPTKMAHQTGRNLGRLAFKFDKRGRKNAIENLTFIFGDEKSQEEIEYIAEKSYLSFAKTVIDQLRSPRLNRDNYLEYVELTMEDMEAIENARDSGAIWVTPHYSNFEWIALIMGFRDYKFTVVAQDFKNKALTEMYKQNREVSGHDVIPQRNALIKLLRALKNKGHAAFLSDLTIPPTKAATVINCFGKPTCVTAIHSELAKRTGLKVIPGICIPLEDGRYEMKGFRPIQFGPDDTEQSIAQACWDVFEPHIRKNPAPWLWMYKHWRYLPSADAKKEFPSYSRPAPKFEAMIADLDKKA